jgi:hypothetical protein
VNEREYAVVTARVAQFWPHSAWPVATCHGAESLLLDLPARVVVAAVEQLAVEGREFAPPPGLVRQRACVLLADPMPDADRALAEVNAAVRNPGAYGHPVWSHPAVGATVDAMGGWQAVCASENPDAFRAHFLKIYGTVAVRETARVAMPDSVRQVMGELDLRADRALGSG